MSGVRLGDEAEGRGMKVDSSSRFPIKHWTDGVPVEDSAMEQLRRVDSVLQLLGIASQNPQLLFLLNQSGVGESLAGSLGIDISSLVPSVSGVPRGLISAQAFAQLEPQQQDSYLTQQAITTGKSREVIIREINRGRPGGGQGQITSRVVG